MPKDNSSLEKWIYWEHTRVKHRILESYLWRWIPSLGKYQMLATGTPGRVCYFDGFAGRGEYIAINGETFPGSPIIAMEVAEKLVEQGRVKEFVPIFIEKDDANFTNLEEVIELNKHRYPHVKEPYLVHGEFAEVISKILNEVGARLAPSFFFIDPFGFAGVPFNLVKNILSIPRTEIFFTFMYRDINRFQNSLKHDIVFKELFGTSNWQGKQDHELRDLYIQQLQGDAGAQYTWSFRMCEDKKVKTLYYLIHATNHFKGLKYMKDIAYNQGGELFAFLGPQDYAKRHQMKLFNDDIPSLMDFLEKRFTGCVSTYKEIEEVVYKDTPLIDKHCNQAIKLLEKERRVKLDEAGPKGGIRENTRITFLSN